MSFDMFKIMESIDIAHLMEVMEKYKDIDVTKVKIKVIKYDNGLEIKVISDSNKIGEILTDLLPLAFGNIPKDNIEIIDKTG